jgi:energy-coupling factor transporter ATP-binding protein EcfA2
VSENRPSQGPGPKDEDLTAHPIIVVEGLRYRYPAGDREVLSGIDLKVMPGEFLGITGPSGAGKTTLCLCLKGLIPHAVGGTLAGRVSVNGLDVARTTPAQLAETAAIVFQDPESQIIGLTVAEDLAFGPENLAQDPDRIRRRIPDMLRVVRLAGFEDRETYGLSGGQKQRVAIAGALMMEPTILVLDEPTSELDPVGKREVFEAVARLRRERQVTVVMVEHEIEALAEVADRIVVLDGGRITADASPRELFRDAGGFHGTERVRVPQAAQVLLALEAEGLLGSDAVTPYEAEAVQILSRILGEGARRASLPRSRPGGAA